MLTESFSTCSSVSNGSLVFHGPSQIINVLSKFSLSPAYLVNFSIAPKSILKEVSVFRQVTYHQQIGLIYALFDQFLSLLYHRYFLCSEPILPLPVKTTKWIVGIPASHILSEKKHLEVKPPFVTALVIFV